MKYEQDRDKTGEILRVVIQKMAGQPAAFTPPNYAVWYEYITGINPALTEAMGSLLDNGKQLDNDTVELLYAKYVSECNTDMQQMLREDIRQLLNQLAEYAEDTDKRAYSFDNNLQTYDDALKQNPDASRLSALIIEMSSDTNKMRDSVQSLQSELAASKQQVEKLHQELESARGEALIDPLTGILNRRGFEMRLGKAFENPALEDKGLCVLMLDIDHFKKINDSYGHLFGDKVIRAVAATLKAKVRGQDAFARLGGEEFAVLLEETNVLGARIVAENIRQSIERGKIRRLDSQEKIGDITISIGVATYTPGISPTKLLDHADKALYASKRNGRNKTTLYGQK